MGILLKRILINEKLTVIDEKINEKIIMMGQNDYRRMITMIYELTKIIEKDRKGRGNITMNDIEEYFCVLGMKDIDKSIHENTAILFSKYTGLNSSLRIFNSDKINMPLMVHQNYLSASNKYIEDRGEKIKTAYELSEKIACGDIIDNYIYSDQNWTLQETYGFYSCVYPSFIMNKRIDHNKINNDLRKKYEIKIQYPYPKDLNRTSTKCINYKKNIKPVMEIFKGYSVDDCILIEQYIKWLLENNKLKKCLKTIDGYDITKTKIMYLMKMNKIDGTKKDINKKLENNIKKICN
jgi:hypothetical protein